MSGLVAYDGSDASDADDGSQGSPQQQEQPGLVSYAFDPNKSGNVAAPAVPEQAEGRAVLTLPVSKDKAALLRHISSTNIFANTPLLQPVPLNVSSPALDPRTIDVSTPPVCAPAPPASYTADITLLPPAPTGEYPPGALEKVQSLLAKTRSGGNVNRQLHSSKKFNNPCIYEHLIAHSGINETGSNYPKNLYDPTRWKPKDYYLELGTAQKDWEEARAKARAQRSEVAFTAARTADGAKRAKVESTAVSGVGSEAVARARSISEKLAQLGKK